MTDQSDGLAADLERVAESGDAHCRLCDEKVVVDADGWGGALIALHDHGVEKHGLPDDEPWTDEMLEEADD